MIRCNVCRKVVSSGDIFYIAHADCKLPGSIPKNHVTYAQNLLEQRLSEYIDLTVCNECIDRAKKSAPVVEKPMASNKEFAKPKPRVTNDSNSLSLSR
jgi:hypothetical protein